jgi:tetratricopeptide (TPR) repeat protein
VFRAGAAYLVLAWLVVQIADILLETFQAPNWVMQALVLLLAAGFILALALSWIYEITVSGIKRTEDVVLEESITHLTGRKLDFIIIGVLVLALSVSLIINFRPSATELPTSPVTILISDFDNQTGNALFNNVIEDALRIGIEMASFVDNYPRNKARTIARSSSDSTTPSDRLNLEDALLVGLQEGIDIVFGGKVEQVDGQIRISVTGTELPDQNRIFSDLEIVDKPERVLTAIAAISGRLRKAIGDIENTDLDDKESFSTTNLVAASEFVNAQELQTQRDLQAAIDSYTRAIQADPGFVRAYVGRAMSLSYLGMREEAKNDWDYVLPRLNELDERGRYRTLILYHGLVTQDWEKALEASERLVERYPADRAGNNNVAVAAFYTLDFQRARKAGAELHSRFPEVGLYVSNLALYSMYAGEFEEAGELAIQSIEQNPESAYGWIVAALLSLADSRITDARRFYDGLAQTGYFGQSVSAEGRADLEISLGNTDQAIEVLEAAIEVDLASQGLENAAIKYAMLAEVYAALGQKQEAAESAELSQQYGTTEASVVASGIVLARVGEFDKVRELANDLSQSLSSHRKAYGKLLYAIIAIEESDESEAIGLLKEAVRLADLWLVRFALGVAYLEGGHIVEAFGEFQLCRERTGEALSVYLNDRPSYRAVGYLEEQIQLTEVLLRGDAN